MELSTESLSRPMQRKRGRVAIDIEDDHDKLVARVNKVNNKSKRQPAPPKGSKKCKLEALTPSSCLSKHRQLEPQTPSPRACIEQHVNAPRLFDDEPPELQLPPPLHPLTESNLREHTQHTSSDQTPIAIMTSSVASKVSSTFDALTVLERYGVTIDNNDNVPNPPVIERFLREIIESERQHETPGAKRLHKIQPQAASAGSESMAIELIEKWLMFREENHDLGGEEYINRAHEVYFPRQYVAHLDPNRSLSQPRADRANGYVSHRQQRDTGRELKSPFTKEEDEIIREYTIHGVAFFAWLTAQFKSATGESLEVAKWQCARDGVAVNKYLRTFFQRAGQSADELATMHWSLVCNAKAAGLFYHWEDGQGNYYMERFCAADLRSTTRKEDRNQQMVYMRKCLRNLLEHVLGPRLKKIKDALKSIQEQREIAVKAAEAKAKAEALRKAQVQTPSRSGTSTTVPSGSPVRTPSRSTRSAKSPAGSPESKRSRFDNTVYSPGGGRR